VFVNHYKLRKEPFGVTPDSRFLYLGAQHRVALASLVYVTESNRGFLALIVKPGMGKTSSRTVRHFRGQTLYHISVERLGRYDRQILAEIRSLNPQLGDPNRIRAGQQVLMPEVTTSTSDDQRPVTEMSSHSLPEVGEK
jgi:type II secretory pathway predicted ATPase ExeA